LIDSISREFANKLINCLSNLKIIMHANMSIVEKDLMNC